MISSQLANRAPSKNALGRFGFVIAGIFANIAFGLGLGNHLGNFTGRVVVEDLKFFLDLARTFGCQVNG